MPWSPATSYAYVQLGDRSDPDGRLSFTLDRSDGHFTLATVDGRRCILIRWVADGASSPDTATATCSFWYRGAAYRMQRPVRLADDAAAWFAIDKPTAGASAGHSASVVVRGPARWRRTSSGTTPFSRRRAPPPAGTP